MWEKRGSVTLTALMAMLVFSLYSIALYGRSVSEYALQEKNFENIIENYAQGLDRVDEISKKVDR